MKWFTRRKRTPSRMMMRYGGEWDNPCGWYRPEMRVVGFEWKPDVIHLVLDRQEFEAYRINFLAAYKVSLKSGNWLLL